MRVNSELAAKSKGFGQTFNNSRDEEITTQLDHVRGVSIVASNECLLPNRVEKWPVSFDLFAWSSGNNEQFRGSCGVRPAEHWCSNILLLSFPMCFNQATG